MAGSVCVLVGAGEGPVCGAVVGVSGSTLML